ncbi:MAG: glycine dehydrogenase (aminomethyl-transferring), partial [Candidatus Nanopelagicales bacterium]|nr:glycine dehydrogenase (aminomethyl-transferring) [Candidatus Nanopelagicales bacterium]
MDDLGPTRWAFSQRHIGPSSADARKMLDLMGFGSVEDLLNSAVPPGILDTRLRLPDACSEPDVLAELRGLASRNKVTVPLIGLGYHRTETPAVIRRGVLRNPAWYTSYTPYQPEISQGRLEAMLNFQTMIAELTALPISNASLLDEPTAAAEAMALARRVRGPDSATFVVDADTHPQTIAVLRTRAEPMSIQLDVRDLRRDGIGSGFGMLISYPTSSGLINDVSEVVASAKNAKMTVCMATDLLALTLLRPPGELGVDIAVGSAQRFGVPMGFGGPHAGFMSVRAGLERLMPGRLVGVSVDEEGRSALRLALQTREQHIRRENATSNICTSQVLLAVMAGSFAVYHGPDG